jgi:hypothetical protein
MLRPSPAGEGYGTNVYLKILITSVGEVHRNLYDFIFAQMLWDTVLRILICYSDNFKMLVPSTEQGEIIILL